MVNSSSEDCWWNEYTKSKAEVINRIIHERSLHKVVGWQLRDDDLLSQLEIQSYSGVDSDSAVVEQSRKRWNEDTSKCFLHTSAPRLETYGYDLSMSIDVLLCHGDNEGIDFYIQEMARSSNHLLFYRSEEARTGYNSDEHLSIKNLLKLFEDRERNFELVKKFPTPYSDFYLFCHPARAYKVES